MALLLCRKQAAVPFSVERLDLKIRSVQELCYIIYNYPLLCMEGLCEEPLFSWLERVLGLKSLSERLRLMRRQGEPADNLMLLILQEGNYYDVQEVRQFGERIAAYRKLGKAEMSRETGKVLEKAGKIRAAELRYEQALRETESELVYTHEESAKNELNRKKADICCDLAALRLRLFDEKGALEKLVAADLVCPSRRSRRMRYLINGNIEITPSEADAFDTERENARVMAGESAAMKDLEKLFEKDNTRLFAEAEEIISRWKSDYRRMN